MPSLFIILIECTRSFIEIGRLKRILPQERYWQPQKSKNKGFASEDFEYPTGARLIDQTRQRATEGTQTTAKLQKRVS